MLITGNKSGLKRNLSNNAFQLNPNETKSSAYIPFEVNSVNISRDISMSISHKGRSSNLQQSRTERDLNSIGG